MACWVHLVYVIASVNKFERAANTLVTIDNLISCQLGYKRYQKAEEE